MTEVHHYRGYVLVYDPPPIPVRNCDWSFIHDAYCWDDDTDRKGYAATYTEAIAEIDAIEDGKCAA